MVESCRTLLRNSLAVAAFCLLAACAATGLQRPSLDRSKLLSGPPALAGATLPPVLTEKQIVGLDDDMRRFVTTQVGDASSADERVRRLLFAMQGYGLFSLLYSSTVTNTARATYHQAEGNCLSFTILFVALARQAGLRVSYQIVDVPPIWSSTGASNVLILNTHVNARVKTSAGYYIVDFNQPRTTERYPSHEITDKHALALFYSNLGAEALIQKRFDAAFSEFRKSLMVYPNSPGAWANLGVLYVRLGDYGYAESAYLQALNVNPSDHSALANLTALYLKEGKHELAEQYEKKVRYYEQHNPYYHYALAQRAYRAHDLDGAIRALEKAIRLKSDEREFYELQGQVYLDLGRPDDAADSFAEAKNLEQPGAHARRGARPPRALSRAFRTGYPDRLTLP